MEEDLRQRIDETHAALTVLSDEVGRDQTEALREALGYLADALEELELTSAELRRQNEAFRRTQQELADQRRAYKELFELAPDAYLVTDRDGVIREANREAGRLLGVPAGRLEGRSLAAFLPAGERPAFHDRIELIPSGETIEAWEFDLRPRARPVIVVSAEVQHGTSADGASEVLRWQLRDVTAARRAQVALQEAFAATSEEAEQLRDIDRWKDAFLAAAAHDLRGPLGVITTAARTLLDRPGLDPDDAQDLLERIVGQSEWLGRLLSDLLDLDRFTHGVVAADRRPTHVDELVADVVATMDFNHHTVTVAAEPVTAEVDGPRVEQILTNLLRNAVGHTPPGTAIHVAVSRESDHVRLVVEDDGPGIPPEVRESLFSPFVTRGTHADDHSGTGIGLSLVQLFVELHGGAVQAEDRSGGGARFVVELPIT